MQYIIDTNALVYAAKRGENLNITIDGQILIPNLVIKELEKLAKTATKGADKDGAKLALQIIKHNKWEQIKLENGHTDTRIKEYAKKHNCKIYTFDKRLKK
jgi:rRNA-processing protein FCF1